MYSRTNDPDQRLAFETRGTGYRAVVQRAGGYYCLNYNDNNGSCIVWHINTAADNDSIFQMVPYADNGHTYYRLKLVGTTSRNLYLTAVGSSLYWRSLTNDFTQVFEVLEPGATPSIGTSPSGGTTTAIPMNVNINQKYASNSDWVKQNGCAVNVNEYLSQMLANIRATFANEYLSHLSDLCYSTLEPPCVSNRRKDGPFISRT